MFKTFQISHTHFSSFFNKQRIFNLFGSLMIFKSSITFDRFLSPFDEPQQQEAEALEHEIAFESELFPKIVKIKIHQFALIY
ncbi:MAG: hypothetical protein PHP74_04655 [Candidatus Gracilibacteria bacterium]|nr:hypothetical protein [Candidatus Gracilibacteria bacterium]